MPGEAELAGKWQDDGEPAGVAQEGPFKEGKEDNSKASSSNLQQEGRVKVPGILRRLSKRQDKNSLKESFNMGRSKEPQSSDAPSDVQSPDSRRASLTPGSPCKSDSEGAESPSSDDRIAEGSGEAESGEGKTPKKPWSMLSMRRKNSTVKLQKEAGSSDREDKTQQEPKPESQSPASSAPEGTQKWKSMRKPMTGNVSEPDTITEEKVDAWHYPLLDIPVTPLSVMQINSHIGKEQMEEAHLNLLSMRLELKKELQESGEGHTPIELVKKEKDLNLLYCALRDKVKNIIRSSDNQELLVHVAQIIQEEEKMEKDPGCGMWSWRDTWKEAVQEGVQAKIESVPLDSKEENKAWLAVHLGQLGRAMVEDLENVKNNLNHCYPPSFNVFSTYMESYRSAIVQHVKRIPLKELETKDSYALLDWIVNRYKSDTMIGSPTLQPDMAVDDMTLPLDDGFLDQIKDAYCDQIRDDLKRNLENVVKLHADVWNSEREPELEDGFYHAEIHMDMWTFVKAYLIHSKNIGTDLEKKVLCICMEDLRMFLQKFAAEFRQWSETTTDPALADTYEVAYINSFTVLKGHLEEYSNTSPEQVEQLKNQVEVVINNLGQMLMEKFKTETQPFFRSMMTKKWLSTDDDFRQVARRMQDLSTHCKAMREPYVQMFVKEVHYYVVRQYISQLMKNEYSCKNWKHKTAAEKMQRQWAQLREQFEELKSSEEWLYPIGDHLCDIIGQENKQEIKNHLQPLIKDYPDIREGHLSAVLYFRGLLRGRERKLILRRLVELKKSTEDTQVRGQTLFTDMQTGVNSSLANRMLSCLPFNLPCLPLQLHDS